MYEIEIEKQEYNEILTDLPKFSKLSLKCFQCLDLDGNGVISQLEFLNFIQKLNSQYQTSGFTQEDVFKLFGLLEPGDAGGITIGDFNVLVREVIKLLMNSNTI